MRRIGWLLILIFIGVSFAAIPTTNAQIEEIYGLINVTNADVRAGPDFAYNTVARLPLNASVQIHGRAGDFFVAWDGRQWLNISWSGGSGWIYARLVRTSRAFNSIPPTGRILPRDNNFRVPDAFDLSTNVCDQWSPNGFNLTGNFNGGDRTLTATYPTLQGANAYSVITISPSGSRTAFDSETGTSIIEFDRLPREEGTYTWRVAPYWTNSTSRYRWQQVCLLRTGGTFEKPLRLPE